MKIRPWGLVLCLFWSVATALAEERQVSGRVVDGKGKPVAEAVVANFWIADENGMKPSRGGKTDRVGRFHIRVNDYGRPTAVMALDHEQTRGGLVVLDSKNLHIPQVIELKPLIAVQGAFFCEELGERPSWTNVYMNVLPEGVRVAMCESSEASFSFKLPPGQYQFHGYGTDVKGTTSEVTLSPEHPVLDLKTVNLAPTTIARHYGKEPPPWNVTDARGVAKDARLSDFKGKWLLLEFWGYW